MNQPKWAQITAMIRISVPYSQLTCYGIENEQPIYPSLTSCPCRDGLFIFCPIIKKNKVSCQYGTLMWIIAVAQIYHRTLRGQILLHTDRKLSLGHLDLPIFNQFVFWERRSRAFRQKFVSIFSHLKL